MIRRGLDVLGALVLAVVVADVLKPRRLTVTSAYEHELLAAQLAAITAAEAGSRRSPWALPTPAQRLARAAILEIPACPSPPRFPWPVVRFKL
jgi:hypothetical protein